jgi:hypothetical protein
MHVAVFFSYLLYLFRDIPDCHSWEVALRSIHTRSRRWKRVSGQLHAPAASPREIYALAVVQEAGWAPKLVWLGPKDIDYTGVRTPDRPAHSVLSCRLRHPVPVTWYLPKCSVKGRRTASLNGTLLLGTCFASITFPRDAVPGLLLLPTSRSVFASC